MIKLLARFILFTVEKNEVLNFFEIDLQLTKISLRMVNVIKILEKLFLKYEQSLNSISFVGIQKKTALRPDGNKTMFVIKLSSIRHHNKYYGYENNKKYIQKPKNSGENCEKVSKPFKP